jgi:hypothetical protein
MFHCSHRRTNSKAPDGVGRFVGRSRVAAVSRASLCVSEWRNPDARIELIHSVRPTCRVHARRSIRNKAGVFLRPEQGALVEDRR